MMVKAKIPIYDICSLQQQGSNNDLLIERFADYLTQHYQHLHFPHRHSFYHLVLFTKGSGIHTIDFTQYKVTPFQLYFMIPGQVHSWHFKGETDGYIVNFSESLFKSFLSNAHYLDRFSFFSGLSNEGVCLLPEHIHTKVSHIFNDLLSSNIQTDENAVDMTRALLLQLFITVDQSRQTGLYKPVLQQKQTLLKTFRKLIEQHYKSIRLPKEYADLLYITPNHLNALCQDMLGKTAGELIRDRILLEAKRLLTNAHMRIAEIAYELNFEDNSYFNRFFKKYTGVTPDEFRKQFNISK